MEKSAGHHLRETPEAPELVVLLAEDGTPLGTQDKTTVHTTKTPLHFAFSTHVFNDKGEILVTRRALSKRAWPGVWTNSFCGHPAPGEAVEDAVVRRAGQELGMKIRDLTSALPDFRYRATDAAGIVENEICPVFTAVIDGGLDPSPDEVMDLTWTDPASLVAAAARTPWAFSPWITLQLPLLYPGGVE
jgi:isopentenyl-diphosphate delta-isomerase